MEQDASQTVFHVEQNRRYVGGEDAKKMTSKAQASIASGEQGARARPPRPSSVDRLFFQRRARKLTLPVEWRSDEAAPLFHVKPFSFFSIA